MKLKAGFAVYLRIPWICLRMSLRRILLMLLNLRWSLLASFFFLLAVTLTFLHLRRLGLLWFQMSLVLTLVLILSKMRRIGEPLFKEVFLLLSELYQLLPEVYQICLLLGQRRFPCGACPQIRKLRLALLVLD